MTNNIVSKNQKSAFKLFYKTQLFLIISSLLTVVTASGVIYASKDISYQYYFYIIASALAVCNFISGFYIGYKIKKNGMINALLYCLPFNILLFFVSVFINSFKIDLTIIFSGIIINSASMLGGILSVNTKTKIRH